MDAQSINSEEAGNQAAVTNPEQSHTNENRFDQRTAILDKHSISNTHEVTGPHKDTNVVPPASPKAHTPSSRSPRMPRSPSLGITVQKGAQRSGSSMSNHSVSSPKLSRKISTSSLQSNDAAATARQAMRRSSSGLPHSSPARVLSRRPSMNAYVVEAQPITATSVASAYLERELAVHKEADATGDTIVILHDDCYGHRFARPRTSKGTLSMIVERPERLQASVIGLSAAYVRLGGRHSEGRQPPHPEHKVDRQLPFLIRKTAREVDLSSNYVTNVHGKTWMEELKTMCNSASNNLASTGKELKRTPNKASDGDSSPKQTLHEGDLYLSPESLNAFQGALGGVCEGIDAIFQGTMHGQGPSRAFVCIRPPGHHCSSDFPSGFCWLNNVHVGIEYAAQTYGLTHAVILDFDLHHGDGSQSITWARNSRVAKMPKNTNAAKRLAIGYYSLHDINSFPCEWGEDEKVQNASLCIENAHNQSVWNVHLEPWKSEADFWKLYDKKYSILLDKARDFLTFHADRLRNAPGNIAPRAAIFLSAGFDASQWEGQGMQRHKVNVPTDFFARFTEDAVKLAHEPGLGVDGRTISVLEGGYSDKALISGVMSHLSGLTSVEKQTQTTPAGTTDELGIDMHRRMGALSLNDQESATEILEKPMYSSSWWSSENLTALEGLVAPGAPAAAPKKRVTSNNTSHYTSPTQSFTAKVVDPTKIYRTTSGYSTHPPTPIEPAAIPIPEVDWLTAVGELSKLLVPQNRQTKSHRAEELSEPRVKKERQSINTLPSAEAIPPAGRMQLRERKAKVPNYIDPKSDDENRPGKAPSKTSRRRTIADVSSLSEDTIPPPPAQLPTQHASEETKTDTATKPKPDAGRNGASAPKPTKITIRTQQKPTNAAASGVTGRKKAPDKPPGPGRAKSKTSKTQAPSTLTTSNSKAALPAASSSTDVNRATQAPPSTKSAEVDIDHITSSMESKLNISGSHPTTSEGEGIKGHVTEQVTPLVEDQVSAPSGIQKSPLPSQPPHSVSDPLVDQPFQSKYSSVVGNPAVATATSPIPAPIDLASASERTSQQNSLFPAQRAQELQSSGDKPDFIDSGRTCEHSAPNHSESSILTNPQNKADAAPHKWPQHFTQATMPYGSLGLAKPIPNGSNGQKLPLFTSQGHIPFGTNPPSNQPLPVQASVGQDRTLAESDPVGSPHNREGPPAATGFAVNPPGTPKIQEDTATANGTASYTSAMQPQQVTSSNQPFADLPPVPDVWDVPDTP